MKKILLGFLLLVGMTAKSQIGDTIMIDLKAIDFKGSVYNSGVECPIAKALRRIGYNDFEVGVDSITFHRSVYTTYNNKRVIWPIYKIMAEDIENAFMQNSSFSKGYWGNQYIRDQSQAFRWEYCTALSVRNIMLIKIKNK